MDLDKLITVEVDGNWYLCELHETEKRTELKNAKEWDEDRSEEENIRNWITTHNLGELRTIRVSKNQGFAADPLSAEQRRLLATLWEDMQEIKKVAIARLENTYFTRE